MLVFLSVIVVPLNMTAVNSAEVLAAIIKCVDFAAIKHTHQRRKDPEKTPYINHPIGNKAVEQCMIIKCFEKKFLIYFRCFCN
jgi:hypothetical protein